MAINFNSLVELLQSGGSIDINIVLARNIGLKETIIYSELLSRYNYFSKLNKLTSDGYFSSSTEDLEEETTLSTYQQGKIIKKLVELGLIKYDLRGIPATRYFKIVTNIEIISKLLVDK